MIKDKKIGVVSLGCDKNRVDTEKMLALIKPNNILVNEPDQAEVVIINTCAFLNDSRKEAIEEILYWISLKEQGDIEKIIVTGCLPQKFVLELIDSLVEVDAFLGVSDYDRILEVLDRVYRGERVNAVGQPKGECGKSRVLTTDGYAYLKIADGCSNHCTYCLIPKIRGKFRSVPIDDLVEETIGLGQVNELILVAQDLTRYGEDLTPKLTLVHLIQTLSKLDNVKSIRLLYCYPEGVSDNLIKEIKENSKVIKYLDIPLQHADDLVLKRMNRKGTFNGYLALIEKLKKEVEGIAIRSTFITGFPGESEQAFDRLVEFIEKAKLFNAGFFKYSREQDTPADKLDGHLLESVKTKRLKKLYSVQKKVVKANLKALVGKTLDVVVEGFDENMFVYYGRAYFNAPDIDGKIYFFSAEETLNGDTVKVQINKATGYDLYGERV